MKILSVIQLDLSRCQCQIAGLLLCLATALPANLSAQKEDQNYSFGAWAGIGLSNTPVYQHRDFSPVFGLDFRFDNSETYLNLLLSPAGLKGPGYADLQKNGLNGEVGFILQNFSRGRLTGQVSNFFYGFDLRLGRLSYSYYDPYNKPSPKRIEEKITWTSCLVRIGYRLRFKRVFVDFALPIGLRFVNVHTKGEISVYGSDGTTIIALPALSAGYRF